ncbi:uncharacterized protein LOC131657200 [Vicia villosa]|uniref:uncharacterized protein LOC131657200 n=1 Tax=Vicia villosa TaxID=3911 RepID=UPI00273CEDFC|nr:uncharacterized protein LOC131657200 [Vicia villosa]
MLVSNMKSIWLLTILVIISLCYYKNVNGEDCENDILSMNIECLIYMNKDLQEPIPPNDRCCDIIKTANFPCVCKNGLSRKLPLDPSKTYADLISWDNVMYCFDNVANLFLMAFSVIDSLFRQCPPTN